MSSSEPSTLVTIQETFEYYAKASGLGSETKVAAALERWGPNRFDVPLPAFSALLQVLFTLKSFRPHAFADPDPDLTPNSRLPSTLTILLGGAAGASAGAVLCVSGVLRWPVGLGRLLVRRQA